MNAAEFSDLLGKLPGDMLADAFQNTNLHPQAEHDKSAELSGTALPVPRPDDKFSAPRWITAAALAACMLFAVGVGALLLRGQRDDLTTQSSLADSSVPETVTEPPEETTTVTGIAGTAATASASVTQQTETVSADVTEEAATGTEQPDASETDSEDTVQTTAVSEARQTDYRAIIGHHPGGVYLYAGEEPDYSNLELTLDLKNASGDTAYQADVFTVGSGKFANLYSLNTGEVNPNVPGTYHVYVESNVGAEDDFNYSDREIPQIGLTPGPVHVTMDWSRNVFQVHVWDENTGLMIGRGQMTSCAEIAIPDDGSEQICTLYNLREGHDGTAYEFEDPTVAEITEKHTDPSGLNQIFSIRGLRIGSTKLTVTAPDGRTAECIIHVTHIGF